MTDVHAYLLSVAKVKAEFDRAHAALGTLAEIHDAYGEVVQPYTTSKMIHEMQDAGERLAKLHREFWPGV